MTEYGLNRIELIGRVHKDPVLRRAGDIRVLKFVIWTREPGYYHKTKGVTEDVVSYHRVAIFGSHGEAIYKWLCKGMLLFIEGRIRTSMWRGKNDWMNYSYEITCHTIRLLGQPKVKAATDGATPEAPAETGAESGLEMDSGGEAVPRLAPPSLRSVTSSGDAAATRRSRQRAIRPRRMTKVAPKPEAHRSRSKVHPVTPQDERPETVAEPSRIPPKEPPPPKSPSPRKDPPPPKEPERHPVRRGGWDKGNQVIDLQKMRDVRLVGIPREKIVFPIPPPHVRLPEPKKKPEDEE